MLLVATIRTTGMGSRGKPGSTTLDRVTGTMGGGARKVVLGPLSADESRALVTELAERAGAIAPRPADIEAIANEAAGYPLFIDVLARQGVASEGKMRSANRLDDALVSQVDALDEDARKVVEVVAVAGEPLAQRVIARAVDLCRMRSCARCSVCASGGSSRRPACATATGSRRTTTGSAARFPAECRRDGG